MSYYSWRSNEKWFLLYLVEVVYKFLFEKFEVNILHGSFVRIFHVRCLNLLCFWKRKWPAIQWLLFSFSAQFFLYGRKVIQSTIRFLFNKFSNCTMKQRCTHKKSFNHFFGIFCSGIFQKIVSLPKFRVYCKKLEEYYRCTFAPF